MTRRTGWLVALGVLALLAFALVTLPAGVVAGPLRKAGIEAGAFGGSIWSGRAAALSWRGAAIGDAEWKIAPVRLLTGRIAGHAKLTRTDGSIETDFDLSFSGQRRQVADNPVRAAARGAECVAARHAERLAGPRHGPVRLDRPAAGLAREHQGLARSRRAWSRRRHAMRPSAVSMRCFRRHSQSRRCRCRRIRRT